MNHDSTQKHNYTDTPLVDNVVDNDYVTEGEVIGASDEHTNGASSEELRAKIERTRSQMSRKIDTIQSKLSPETIKAQAQDTLRSAVEDGTNALVGYWRENQTQIRQSVVSLAKNNPIPTALIGAGIGWALIDSFAHRNKPGYGSQHKWDGYRHGANYQSGQYPGSQEYPSGQPYGSTGEYASAAAGYSSSEPWQGEAQGGRSGQASNSGSSIGDKVSQAVDQVRETASDLAEKVSTKANEIAGQAQDKSQQYGEQMSAVGYRAQERTQQIVQSNPLAVGGVALALGAMIGMLLPTTERENEMMGDLRNQVKDRAQAAIGEAKQRVQQAVDDVKPEMQNLANKVVDDLKGSGQFSEPDRNAMNNYQDVSSNESDDTLSDTTMADQSAQSGAGGKAKKQKDRSSSYAEWDKKVKANQTSSQLP